MDKKLYLIQLLKNRICVMFGCICILFFMLFCRLYQLQVLHGEEYKNNIKVTTVHKVPVPAQRGSIYDRYGRPIALNRTTYSSKLDLSIPIDNLNEILLSYFQLMDVSKCEYQDDLPITVSVPYVFTFHSDSAEKNWKRDMGFKEEKLNYTAEQTLNYLEKFFDIPGSLSQQEKRRLISIRSKIYMQRYRKYNAVTIATDITPELIAMTEERQDEFKGIYIDVDSLRYYPQGENLSHILGYVGSINETELEEYEKYGYTSADSIGKLGIEKAYELQLRGNDGEKLIEIDAMGQRMRNIESIPAQNGKDVFLTVDSRLQEKTRQVLENNLKDVLLTNMSSGSVSTTQIFHSMIDSNAISLRKIMNANAGQTQFKMREKIMNDNPRIQLNNDEDEKLAKECIKDAISTGEITGQEMLLCLYEQKKITLEEDVKLAFQSGAGSVYEMLKEKIITGELTVSDINIVPCTGSVAVVDVQSGDVLSLVTYPSYDNNKLVNSFDNEYYQELLNNPNSPLINRPVMERKAPGSIAKMMFALAGLETGVITEHSTIQDKGIFKKAGLPYAKCLIYSRYGGSHGAVDVRHAIEVSCNYFFYELAYRLGNAKDSSTLNSISVLDDYMKKFGLDDVSGIEIEESRPNMATPESKAKAILALNENASKAEQAWSDGDSIRCAIGQSYNSYTAINMAKYMATLANGGTRYKTTIVKGIQTTDNVLIPQVPEIEEKVIFKDANLQAVYEGMLLVTTGRKGTLRTHFSDYPIKVAAKTGTAEEDKTKPSHSWFAGFAPYDEPQIAVVVLIPFGETSSGPAIKTAKDVISEYMGLNSQPKVSLRYQNTLAE